jgi:acyl-homoserine-lactone acylase
VPDSGLFGPRRDPKLTRSDYVANSNNSPWLANPATRLTGYPPVFDTRRELELRPRLSLNMIAQRLAGTHGCAAEALLTLTPPPHPPVSFPGAADQYR